MNLKTILVLFSMIFLVACNGNDQKVSDLEQKLEQKIEELNKQLKDAIDPEKAQKLEQKIEELNKQLKDAIDPEKAHKLQVEIIKVQREKMVSMEKKKEGLLNELYNTKDKESCEKLTQQVSQLHTDIGRLILEFQIGFARNYNSRLSIEDCTDGGYKDSRGPTPPQ